MKIEWKTCVKITLSLFALYLAITYWKAVSGFIGMVFGAATPLFIGAAAAYVVNLLMGFYERKFFSKAKVMSLLQILLEANDCALALSITTCYNLKSFDAFRVYGLIYNT